MTSKDRVLNTERWTFYGKGSRYDTKKVKTSDLLVVVKSNQFLSEPIGSDGTQLTVHVHDRFSSNLLVTERNVL